MKCLILAGGMSSRMKASSSSDLDSKRSELANTMSKGLLPIGPDQKPFMLYLMDQVKAAGIHDFIILLNEKDTTSKDILSAYNNDYHIEFVTQFIPADRKKPFGTADAVFQAMSQNESLKTETFIVCNTDNLYSKKAFEALKNYPKNNAMIAYDRDALNFPEEKILAFALSHFDENFTLKSIIEKPNPKDAESYRDADGKFRISMNIFKFSGTDFYDAFKNCPTSHLRNEKEIPSAIMLFIKKGGSFHGIPLAEHVPDLTTKDDILLLEKSIKQESC